MLLILGMKELNFFMIATRHKQKIIFVSKKVAKMKKYSQVNKLIQYALLSKLKKLIEL
jgi:hypothetical protein